MELSISTGNTKLGKIHNISLPPVQACPKRVPCETKCYARKSWVMYKNVRDAWTKNWDAFKKDPNGYFETIANHCATNQVTRFRWHVAGDIPNLKYLAGMNDVASANPETQFLAFTKNKDTLPVSESLEDNLRITFSMWPGWLSDKQTLAFADGMAPYPLAWYGPKECDNKVYNTALDIVGGLNQVCNGACDECFMCWYFEPGMSVLLKEH
jgi:hypothetical protein